MVNHLTSAFGGDTITVDEMVKDPHFIPERVLTNLDGAFLEAALFRNGGPNDGVVAFREAAAPFLNDDSEEVAEFAEIPVSDLNRGKLHKVIGVKTALGVRISREMRRFNKIDQLNLRLTALQNTMVKNGVEASLAAFKSAEIPELAVGSDWESQDADPMRDIRKAKRMISTATAPDRKDALMGYKPDVLVTNEGTLDAALFHESVQRFYRGNAAVENPVYQGITPQILAGLRVVTSQYIPEGDVYIMQSGVAGFISDADPLTITPLYAENGENGFGGANQSWRMDAFRNRVIAVDNPRAVVKLTGVGS
ncbi:hypothetical protein [Corynebacterium mastitidis]|uniref:phage major capsid protein n=1 Tax=Corynebacterium mastitidis TaxID=161890 RepID=UPI00037B0B38|nr:hypothetical protein [Corynebacterium mastitidis]